MDDPALLDVLVSAVIAKAQARERRGPTVAAFLETWMAERVEPECAWRTARGRRYAIDNHLAPGLGAIPLEELTSEDIDRLGARMRRTMQATTVNAQLGVLRACLRYAEERHQLSRAPRVRMLPTEERDPDWLTEEARDALLGAASGWLRAAVALGALAGLRVSEILALEWRDVRWGSRSLHICRGVKTRRPRTVPMCSRLHEELQAWRHLRGPRVICYDDGARVSHSIAWRRLRDLAAAEQVRTVEGVLLCSGGGKGWHVLRHTFASHLVQRGVSLYEVRDLLGHRAIRHTEVYAHLSPARLVDAVGTLDVPSLSPDREKRSVARRRSRKD